MCAVREEIQTCVFAVSIRSYEFLNSGVYATTWNREGQIVEFSPCSSKRLGGAFWFRANGDVRQLFVEFLRTALWFGTASVNLDSRRLDGSLTRTGSGRFPGFRGYAADRPGARYSTAGLRLDWQRGAG